MKTYMDNFNAMNKYNINDDEPPCCSEASSIEEEAKYLKILNEKKEPELNEIEMCFNVLSVETEDDLTYKGMSHRYKFNI